MSSYSQCLRALVCLPLVAVCAGKRRREGRFYVYELPSNIARNTTKLLIGEEQRVSEHKTLHRAFHVKRITASLCQAL